MENTQLRGGGHDRNHLMAQNAVVFHSYGTATRYTNGVAALESSTPLPYHQVFIAGGYRLPHYMAVLTGHPCNLFWQSAVALCSEASAPTYT